MRRWILITLLLAFGSAQASEWVSLGKVNYGKADAFIDVSSIRITGVVRRAWFKMAISPHTIRGFGDNANKWVSILVTRTAFNCDAEAYRDEAQNEYFTDKSMVIIPAPSFPDSWLPIAPDTFASIQMQFICATEPK